MRSMLSRQTLWLTHPFFAALLALGVGPALTAQAQKQWKGLPPATVDNPSDGRWNVVKHWSPDGVPQSAATTAIEFRSATVQYRSANDLPSPFLLNRLALRTGSGSQLFTLEPVGESTLQFEKNGNVQPRIDLEAAAGKQLSAILQHGITIDTGVLEFTASGGGRKILRLYKPIRGDGSVSIRADATTVIILHGASSYAGGTTLAGGKVALYKDDAFGTGDVTLRTGAHITPSGEIPGVASVVLPNRVFVRGSATYCDAQDAEISSELSLDGEVNIDRTYIYKILSYPPPPHLPITRGRLIINGRIVEPPNMSSGLIKEGPGKMILTSGQNNFTGPVTVREGELVVKDSHTNIGTATRPCGQVRVQGPRGKLSGKGRITTGNQPIGEVGVKVEVAGQIQGGNSPGVLSLVGDLKLDPGAILVTELAGPMVAVHGSSVVRSREVG